MNYNITGNTYLLYIELLNTGSMKIGLKEFDAMMEVDSLNMRGRLLLQFPFVLEQDEKETIKVNFFLESGTHEDLSKIFSHNIPVNLSGKTVLILNSAEVPLDFTITIAIPW
ncbi:MAG: hypothetical protein QXH91_06940 [Candidatus Bathyarchaeia archaeon]